MKSSLLTDEQMYKFLTQGYVQIKADFEDDLHQRIYDKIEHVFEHEGNPGNNILPRIPEIQQVFDHPKVVGAITSLVGPNHVMHPHRYCHLRAPQSTEQSWHKDDYIFDQNVRHHRFRWIIAFYYPQDVTKDMGPTAVLPGYQYRNTISNTNPTESTEDEIKLCGRRGTVSLVNFDVWHRGSANLSTHKRYMLKFQFRRMEEPTEPSWRCESTEWKPSVDHLQDRLSEDVWHWLCGASSAVPISEDIDDQLTDRLITELSDVEEEVRLQAAYRLGRLGPAVVDRLIEALNVESRRNQDSNAQANATNPQGGNPSDLYSAHALTRLDQIAIPLLIGALEDANCWVRAAAADIIGNIVPRDEAQDAVAALVDRLQDPVWWVRRNAVEALGNIGFTTQSLLDGFKPLLKDEHELVRRNALVALSKLHHDDKEMVDMLMEKLTQDEDRYVRFYAATALHRTEASQAREALVNTLLSSRWCGQTTADSPY